MTDPIKVALPTVKRLVYLPEIDRARQSEVDYFRKHGITLAQGAARDEALRRQDFEADAVKDLDGDPPADICDVEGLSPKRARYARYRALNEKIAGEYHALEERKAKLESMIAAVDPAKAERLAGVRRTAAALLGREGGGEVDAAGLASRLATAEHQAEAAKVALIELEVDLDRARVRLKHLQDREAEFLDSALMEVAEESGLVADYLGRIDDLRAVAGLVFGLAEILSYGSGVGRPSEPIALPRISMPSVTAAPADFIINNRGARDVWEKLADALRHDPRQNLTAFIKPPAPAGGYSSWPWKGEGAS